MTLRKWVEQNGGAHETSKLLKKKASYTAVLAWIRNGNLPRAPLMQDIYRLSKGRVTYRIMVEGALEVRNAKKRQ